MNKRKTREILTIIPARGGSQRIPQKNIMPILGKPLVVHSIEHALGSQMVTRVIVSTDDDRIAKVSSKAGAEIIRRPRNISGSKAPSEVALLHVLDRLKKEEGYVPDIVVFLQCTSILRRKEDIDMAIKTFLKSKADSLFSAVRFNKYIWKVPKGSARPLNYDFKKRWREQDFPVQYQENGSIYVFRPEHLKKHKNRLGGKIAVYEMDELSYIQVDTSMDVALLEGISKMLTKGRREKRG